MDTPIKITRQRGNEVPRVTNISFLQTISIHNDKTVPDPDLEIRGGGGGGGGGSGIEIYKNDHYCVTYVKTIALIFKQTLLISMESLYADIRPLHP